MVHGRLAQHCVVLDLALAQRGAVVRDQNELRVAVPQRLEGGLDAKLVLACRRRSSRRDFTLLRQSQYEGGSHDAPLLMTSCNREPIESVVFFVFLV